MWISRRKYKEITEELYKQHYELEALYKHVRELDDRVHKNTYDIQNNVHYISPPSDGKKVLHG